MPARKSRGKWDTLVILLVLGVSVGMSLAACVPGWSTNIVVTPNPDNPTLPPTVTVTVTAPNGETRTWELNSPEAPLLDLMPECPTPPAPIPTGTPPAPSGQPTPVNDNLLRTDRGITGTSGHDFYYKFYIEVLFNNTSGWWWREFGKDGQFSIWDAFAVVYSFETDRNWTDPNIAEAAVRKGNEWCKTPKYGYGHSCNSIEEYINWFAHEYQSAGNYVRSPDSLTSQFEQLAMSSIDLQATEKNGAAIGTHPEWKSGCNNEQTRPCSWANPSTYFWQGRKDLGNKMLKTDPSYFFTKNPPVDDPDLDPWIIPSGCIYIHWISGNHLNVECPKVR